ncbi:MAG: NAD(P)/FAD-dependent oxidoreductase, partial [Clostridia bacterium]|nr:NAD(P)/FAD-dependent oxidoreductase [Clostridia bacterium]
MYDIIVIGGGPAGLTAAIYGQRLGKKVLVIEKENFGGQMTFSPKIENYPGFVSISGSELAQNMVEQAGEQGAEFVMEEVTGIEVSES